jgi:hypothetical protein
LLFECTISWTTRKALNGHFTWKKWQWTFTSSSKKCRKHFETFLEPGTAVTIFKLFSPNFFCKNGDFAEVCTIIAS